MKKNAVLLTIFLFLKTSYVGAAQGSEELQIPSAVVGHVVNVPDGEHHDHRCYQSVSIVNIIVIVLLIAGFSTALTVLTCTQILSCK